MNALEIRNVTSGYGFIRVLHAVSLVVSSKEIVTIIGVNGAGKSTLLRTVSGLVPCKGGKVIFQNREISRLPAYKIAKLGLIQIPEGRQLFGTITVYENLLLGTYANKKSLNKREKEKLFEFVFGILPVLDLRKQQIAGTLSGGEQQMLCIGRALMGNPQLLLLDEPSLGLAPLIVENITQILKKLNQEGLPCLLVEQNALMALSLAHRGYVLDLGNIIMQGEAGELINDSKVKEIYLGEEMESTSRTAQQESVTIK